MIQLKPIGVIENTRDEITDDYWDDVSSIIRLDQSILEDSATMGLEMFSHIEVIFYMHKVEKVMTGARHPRNNSNLPQVGVLAQRNKNRPNQLGVSYAKIIAVDGLTIRVNGLDAINGTPVLDIKPCIKAFLPKQSIKEPAWTDDIMRNYFK
ncbi:MAG: SAM-dependent methyltransferase [Pseudomonadota bacterium]